MCAILKYPTLDFSSSSPQNPSVFRHSWFLVIYKGIRHNLLVLIKTLSLTVRAPNQIWYRMITKHLSDNYATGHRYIRILHKILTLTSLTFPLLFAAGVWPSVVDSMRSSSEKDETKVWFEVQLSKVRTVIWGCWRKRMRNQSSGQHGITVERLQLTKMVFSLEPQPSCEHTAWYAGIEQHEIAAYAVIRKTP